MCHDIANYEYIYAKLAITTGPSIASLHGTSKLALLFTVTVDFGWAHQAYDVTVIKDHVVTALLYFGNCIYIDIYEMTPLSVCLLLLIQLMRNTIPHQQV